MGMELMEIAMGGGSVVVDVLAGCVSVESRSEFLDEELYC